MAVTGAYNQATASGLYRKPSGLRGKYDHVRRLWEDEVIRIHTLPYLERLVRKRGCTDGLRILDLGCGCGDGYELLFGPVNAPSGGVFNRILSRESLCDYTGVDVNKGLLEQGRCLLKQDERVRFIQGDFLSSLPVEGEAPYDLYLANYGTLSHCEDEELIRLLAEVARHAADGSLIIGDWLGCYAYEWQDYWMSANEEPLSDHTIPYVISYLYDAKERTRQKLDAFSLRLMHPLTLKKLIGEAARRAGVHLVLRSVFDRSVMVGRHMETGEYHPTPQPLRTQVNSLLEPGRSTDLQKLEAVYHSRSGFDALNEWYADLVESWNSLVWLTGALLCGEPVEPEKKRLTKAVKDKGLALCKLAEEAGGLELENLRENIIEPQLAYALRNLESKLQKGDGTGHGLTVVLEVIK